jgi:hypothetical protein
MTSLERLQQRFGLRFADPGMEKRYQIAVLPRDRQRLTAILMVALVFQVVNFASDHQVVSDPMALDGLRWLRILGAVSSLAGMATIRRIRDPFRFEMVAAVWGIVTAATVVGSFALLPRDYLAHTAWSVMLVLAMYAALPMRLGQQVLVAAIFTIGDALILTYLKDYGPAVVRSDILTAHLCAHVIGVVTSWQYKRARRDQFLAIRDAEHAHTQEQRAWSEVNVLHGILPICANCKRIRGDAGEWSSLETYVRRHSEADFSHGICPDCERDLYGNLPSTPGA